MKNVPSPIQVPHLSGAGSAHQVRTVSALAAEPDEASQTVVLRLRDPENQMPFAFALSLSAAAQLSQLLEQAVQKYLYPNDQS